MAGGLQAHPRVPNGLGSALTGVAIPAAAQYAIAVPDNAFLISKGQDPSCRGQNAAMLTPTKNPAW